MENLKLSRFITHPSTVEKSNNHTMVLVDATETELAQLERFLKVSQINFDVYLYQGDTGDLDWLNYVSQQAEYTLVNNQSQVNITNSQRYTSEPWKYLEHFEQQTVDNTAENIL
jgi:hypothetical protein